MTSWPGVNNKDDCYPLVAPKKSILGPDGVLGGRGKDGRNGGKQKKGKIKSSMNDGAGGRAGKGSWGSGPEWMGGPHKIFSMVILYVM